MLRAGRISEVQGLDQRCRLGGGARGHRLERPPGHEIEGLAPEPGRDHAAGDVDRGHGHRRAAIGQVRQVDAGPGHATVGWAAVAAVGELGVGDDPDGQLAIHE